MRIQPIILILCYLLICSIASISLACPPPSCPTCYFWNGHQCVPSGNCVTDCDCEDCSNCVECHCEYQCNDCEVCDGYCKCIGVKVNCLYDCCTYVDDWYVFSSGFTGPNSYCVHWSAPGGDPSSGIGAYFQTHWDTPGVKEVTVSTSCGSSDANNVNVCRRPCCDSWDCQHCVSGSCEPCLEKASNYEELMACSNVVPDPDWIPSPNGCSSPLPNPDNPTGCSDTSFLEACNAHDVCYQTCNSNKDNCDNAFLDEMLEICMGSSCAPRCSEFAIIYYGAVHNYGDSAYQNDQVAACACCDCN